MKKGLILVDIQNDYFANGKMELVGMAQAAENAAKVLQIFRSGGEPIFHVHHISVRPGATFFLPGTRGAQIHDAVLPREGESVVEKHFPNSFRDTELLDNIRNADIKKVVICGAMSHMCIDASTRAAFDLGFQCIVIDDACATRDLYYGKRAVAADQVHAAFMGALSGTYADLVKTEQFRLP